MHEAEVLAEVERIIEDTPEAMGQRIGHVLADELDRAMHQWIVTNASRLTAGLTAMGMDDPTEFVLHVMSRTLRRYADGLT